MEGPHAKATERRRSRADADDIERERIDSEVFHRGASVSVRIGTPVKQAAIAQSRIASDMTTQA
jgi:hypothetical protein